MNNILKYYNLFVCFIGTCLFLSFLQNTYGFISLRHHHYLKERPDSNLLIGKVHESHWDIIYGYGDECSDEKKAEFKEFEKMMTTALQMWLQPLREINTDTPIVSDFRYHLRDKTVTFEEMEKADLSIKDFCEVGRSGIGFDDRLPPRIVIRRGMLLDDVLMSALIHEIGHAFGLGDTYIGRSDLVPSASKGGLINLIGTQPASIMGMHVHRYIPNFLTEDDKNGIVWIYKAFHEELDPEDCFFTNYKYEETPDGCVPKSPLIFEIRQGHEKFTLDILRDDVNIDINAQDGIGYTALHYGVMGQHMPVVEALLSRRDQNINLQDERGRTVLHLAISNGYAEILAALLKHKDILVHLKDNLGRTPVTVARENGDTRLAKRLLAHPNYTLPVTPQRKLATKWGSLKRRY